MLTRLNQLWVRKRATPVSSRKRRGFRPQVEILEDRFAPAVYTVINLLDAGAGAAGAGDLRWCITQANANAGADTIVFNIAGAGPYVIDLANALPDITDPVTIDGRTQGGFAGTPLIELNGTPMIAGVVVGWGLTLTGGNAIIDSLNIRNFTGGGIFITEGGANQILNCYIGVGASGTRGAGNAAQGVSISDSSDNIIGGDIAGTGNLISGNGGSGVYISGMSQRNKVRRNIIGADITGTVAIANGVDGVRIDFGAQNTIVGGSFESQRNLISGNAENGIHIGEEGTQGTVVTGNLIGTTLTGLAALGNGLNGVLIETAAASNIIGQNRNNGTYNVISGNGQNGVHITGDAVSQNLVKGNYIGVGIDGATVIGNQGLAGVWIESGTQNTVGGNRFAGEGNIISGNAGHGVAVSGDSDTVTNKILGNNIGTDKNGQAAKANGLDGVHIGGTKQTVVGGVNVGDRNVISGNTGTGITISADASFTTLAGNYIGVNENGMAPVANKDGGVTISGSVTDTTIAINVISGNGGGTVGPTFQNGVALLGNSTRTLLKGNYIGTDISGNVAIANQRDGLYIQATSTTNTIGGQNADRNYISGNLRYGVEVDGNNNVISFNTIGKKKNGQGDLPNTNGWSLDIGIGNTWANNLHN